MHQSICMSNTNSPNIIEEFRHRRFFQNHKDNFAPHARPKQNLSSNEDEGKHAFNFDPDPQNSFSTIHAINNADTTYEPRIPCEFCNELYDMDSLIVHQSACEKPFGSMDGVKREVDSIIYSYCNLFAFSI